MATVTTADIDQHIRSGNLDAFFVEQLNWDLPEGWETYDIAIPRPGDGEGAADVYRLVPIVEKRGIVLFACEPNVDGVIPNATTRRAIDKKLTEYAHEHLIVFHNDRWDHQIWQYTDREPGTPLRPRMIEMHPGHSGQAVAELLSRLAFDIDDEESTLVDVLNRVRAGIPADAVTKKFYREFNKRRASFETFIEGIADKGDRAWYASIMLNRLMFVWFVQAKGFLDNDPDYLVTRFDAVTRRHPSDGSAFMSFYRAFLRKLFDEGLDTPKELRDPEVVALIGDVPYLNGGIFDQHELERVHEIDIPDKAFAELFDFFGQYKWHLDNRPLEDDREINPDVIGYIFEQFVNQKEKGAYYTKEDVTGYIGQNTILPWVLDQARKECAIAFRPEQADNVWTLLRRDPDRYIYPAMKHGVVDAKGNELPMPDAVAPGIDDIAQRGNWNQRATEPYALPTETWREYVHRRRRTLDLRSKLRAGEVCKVDDLITLNLDIRQFAQDIVEQFDDPALLRAMYKAVNGITVLDPTCGSGAFLFAALEILRPLHEGCLAKMEELVNDLPVDADPKRMSDFKDHLKRMRQHPSREYYIERQIVLNNLYGVDIEEEAVEICKIRLFLSMVAKLERASQIEPLPDIDFNIRAGNTLVGYVTEKDIQIATGAGQMSMDLDDKVAKIRDKVEIADKAFQHFKRVQQEDTAALADLPTAKAEYRRRLQELRDELDGYLHRQQAPGERRESWKKRTQPFHWFVEFHGVVVGKGGFDAIIGNPPYVEMAKVKDYTVSSGFKTVACGNLYATVVERAIGLIEDSGRFGVILPSSAVTTPRMQPLSKLMQGGSSWYSYFDFRPSTLFAGVNLRLMIAIARRNEKDRQYHSTSYIRWYTEERPIIFEVSISYHPYMPRNGLALKIGNEMESGIFRKVSSSESSVRRLARREGSSVYYHDAILYWIRATDFVPSYNGYVSSHVKKVSLQDETTGDAVALALNSSLFYWWWIKVSNCRDLTADDVYSFQIPKSLLADQAIPPLLKSLMDDYLSNSEIKQRNQKQTGLIEYREFNPVRSKPVIDEIDALLAKHYQLDDEELDFIKNYDIKYRLGRY